MIPQHIIDLYVFKFGDHPSIIKCDGLYMIEEVRDIMEKNDILWANESYLNKKTEIMESLVFFPKTTTYLYISKEVDKFTFDFLLSYKSRDSVLFYLNQLSKNKK